MKRTSGEGIYKNQRLKHKNRDLCARILDGGRTGM
jgi:hypothetical protein